ncbi:MAG: right-handed parallel beta-helix repeat-containing protein, partial [Thermoplasmata archaeon]|nr:right-handed parallel beta-helix repeat-containing protein [Thermoplasmata archaeon]
VNGLVENNTLTRNDWCGAAVLDSTDNTLAYNYVEDNWLGLYLDNADYNNIVGNDIQANRDSGMYIYESDNNNIIENTVMNSEWGIYVDSSEYNDIVENTCSQALLFEGITVVSYSAYNYIANNTCNNNTNHGIGLWESDDNVIWNNTCQGNDNFGVALWDSQRITVEANILEENLGAISIDNSTQIMALDNQIASNYNHGIFIEDSDLCTIDGNIMTDNGISINSDVLANWNTHTIPDTNTVSGRSVCYLKNQTGGAAPADAAQVILANCTGMLVNGQNNSNIEIGISLGFSSNNTVSDNIASHNNQHGIYLQLSDGIIIQNNTISSNQFDGLSLSGSNYCSMYENRISGNDCGIRLDNSSNNTIWNNDIFENQERGFTYPMAEAGCSDNSISHNGKKNMQSSQLTTGPEPPAYVLNLEGIKPAALDYQVVIQDVPVYLWEDGCGPTSMGMVMGYWDGAGFDNLVEGDASSQTTAVNNMISSQGNWDDYCLPLDNWPVKPDKSELPMGDEHDSDSIADFSMTSRSYYDNAYGWSWNKHSIPGYVGYVQHVAPEYKISLDDKEWGELTWDNFRAEIDANHPVFLVVDTDADGYTDHAVVAIGYGEEAGVPMYNCLDTWDMSYDHWYEFNEMQSGRSFGIFKGMFFDLEKSGYGFHLESSDGNQIHHNNIINNTIQSFDDGDNSWDNGYPSGGNYWSDYQVLDHAIIETNYGNITFQMYPDEIPITTENFISYVEADFYSDTLFHRVIDNFVIQGGGYYRDSGNLTLKTELYPPIPLETSPVRTHTDGAVSMAREADPDSATCQFFICDGPQPFLDDNYAVFGHVVEGMDVVRTIAALPKQSEGGLFDVPVDDVIINRISLVNITVADEYCGPNQDLEGGDGLGDIPYYGIANIDLSVDIVNETVLTTTGDVWNFNIGYTDIIYCTLWVNEGGAWWNLDAYCLVDYATGEVTMSDGWPLWTGLSIHAWLNYITPNIAQDNYPLMAPVDHNLESYAISLDEGWNLISLPLAPCHESIIQVLSGIDGKWDYILTYDAAIDNPWQSCNVIKPHQLNNLRELDTSMGIWINVTQQNVTLTVYGHAPATTSMELHAGWNLVGYPSLNTTMTIADAFWGTGANIVEICDTGQPYNLCEVGPTYIMQPGEGYWVHVPADTIWIVDW